MKGCRMLWKKMGVVVWWFCLCVFSVWGTQQAVIENEEWRIYWPAGQRSGQMYWLLKPTIVANLSTYQRDGWFVSLQPWGNCWTSFVRVWECVCVRACVCASLCFRMFVSACVKECELFRSVIISECDCQWVWLSVSQGCLPVSFDSVTCKFVYLKKNPPVSAFMYLML